MRFSLVFSAARVRVCGRGLTVRRCAQKLPYGGYCHSRERLLRLALPLLLRALPHHPRSEAPLVSQISRIPAFRDQFAHFDPLRIRRTNRWALFYPLAGMFFDVFDGKVARWRNESSMLGQELDSLADSVRPSARISSVSVYNSADGAEMTLDLVRSRSSYSRILHWAPHAGRYPLPYLLHLRWNCSTRPLQRNGRPRPSRRKR